jgi:hypothetical protein
MKIGAEGSGGVKFISDAPSKITLAAGRAIVIPLRMVG